MELKKYKKKRITPQGWKEVTLADAFNTSSGATPLSTEASYYENGTIPWINSGELASPYIYGTTNFISQAGFENSSTEIYPIDTVLVAMYGATAGKASLLKMEACTNQAICAILPNKDYSSTFLKYSIDTLYDHLVGLSSGSARDNLSQAELKKLKLIMPPTKDEQNKLVSILALIDRKIELNRAINQNLEAMAKQLYDYWFVQFDFPNKEGKPYKSSGGEMLWNEKLKREIPKGWESAKLDNLFQVVADKAKKMDIQHLLYAPIEVLPRKQMSFYDTAPIENAMSGLCKFKKGNILLSNRRVYFHKVCIAPFDGVTRDTVIVLKILNGKTFGFDYQIVNSELFISYATKFSYGSEQPVFSWQDAKNYYYAKPNNGIAEIYSNCVAPLINKVLEVQNELKELTKQRDELLPLLMNGQVSVNSDLSAY